MDVLIVNPTLVKTGLDLVMFSSMVFYELPDQLTTMRQAMKRVHRLGQSQPVDVHYLVYNKSLESSIYETMGKRLKTAVVLEGKEAIGALMAEDDSDDIRRQMIQNAMSGIGYKDLGELFGETEAGLFSELNEMENTGEMDFGEEEDDIVEVDEIAAAEEDPDPVFSLPLFNEQQFVEAMEGGVMQLGLFGGSVPAEQVKKRRRRKTRSQVIQVSLFASPPD